MLFNIWGAYRYCGYKVDQTGKALFVGKTFTLLERLDIYRRLKWFPVCFNAWREVEFALRIETKKMKRKEKKRHFSRCMLLGLLGLLVWYCSWLPTGEFNIIFFCEIILAQKVSELLHCKAKQKENHLRFRNWMRKLWLLFQFCCSSVNGKIKKGGVVKDWKSRGKKGRRRIQKRNKPQTFGVF